MPVEGDGQANGDGHDAHGEGPGQSSASLVYGFGLMRGQEEVMQRTTIQLHPHQLHPHRVRVVVLVQVGQGGGRQVPHI